MFRDTLHKTGQNFKTATFQMLLKGRMLKRGDGTPVWGQMEDTDKPKSTETEEGFFCPSLLHS